jgi:hypothetical protein
MSVLSASFESLVGSLAKSSNEPYDKFKHTRFHMGQNELLFSKGIFPYEYFDTLDKFQKPRCLLNILSTVISAWKELLTKITTGLSKFGVLSDEKPSKTIMIITGKQTFCYWRKYLKIFGRWE